MLILRDFAYGLAVLLATPLLVWRRIRRGPGAAPLTHLLGRVPSRRVASRCVWIHAVSLGEVNAVRTLVATLHKRCPEVAVVISSTTRTGLSRARALFPDLVVFRYPLDFSFAVRESFARIRPSLIVLMELEVWPNLLEIASRRRIPVIVANGRVTAEKSMRRFSWPIIRGVARRMFRQLAWVGAQDETYADRFRALGVPNDRVEVVGSVKYDTADLSDSIAGQDELARDMGIDPTRPLWVCGSTGPDEELIILDAYTRLRATHPEVQLALIPRKPERFDEVATLIVARGFACLRRSNGRPTLPGGQSDAIPVFLGDTLGELRKFYGLSAAVFVGRTLVPLGGSDLMEVAGLGRAVVVGPHLENFREAAELLRRADALIEVYDAATLAAAVSGLLGDETRRRRLGRAARAAIASQRGATDRTVDRVLALMGSAE